MENKPKVFKKLLDILKNRTTSVKRKKNGILALEIFNKNLKMSALSSIAKQCGILYYKG